MSESEDWIAKGSVPSAIKSLLKGRPHELDEVYPKMEAMLRERRADECWHKHGTFLEHLTGVWRLMSLWGQDKATSRCALFHSAYGNGRVNLAIFNSFEERQWLQKELGEDAEALTYLFCTVNRREAVYGVLVPMVERGELIPAEGITVPAIAGRPVESVHLDLQAVWRIIVLTMADFADQNYGYQDKLFDHNRQGIFQFTGNNPKTLWPGDSRPGYFMSGLCRLSKVLHAVVAADPDRFKPLLPAVLGHCSHSISFADDQKCVENYWHVILNCVDPEAHDEALERLSEVLALNPYLAEPNLLVAQIYLHRRNFEAAGPYARRGLELLCQWGTAWDKRVAWETWISAARLLVQQSSLGEWPDSAWGMISLGLVRE